VARIERDCVAYADSLASVTADELRALIASWRKRGEALKEARTWIAAVQSDIKRLPGGQYDSGGIDIFLAQIDGALNSPS